MIPTPKELKKLASACRKAGIKHFKGDGFEFTLEDLPTVVKPATVQTEEKQSVQGKVESDEPSPEDILFWSAQGIEPEEGMANDKATA